MERRRAELLRHLADVGPILLQRVDRRLDKAHRRDLARPEDLLRLLRAHLGRHALIRVDRVEVTLQLRSLAERLHDPLVVHAGDAHRLEIIAGGRAAALHARVGGDHVAGHLGSVHELRRLIGHDLRQDLRLARVEFGRQELPEGAGDLRRVERRILRVLLRPLEEIRGLRVRVFLRDAGLLEHVAHTGDLVLTRRRGADNRAEPLAAVIVDRARNSAGDAPRAPADRGHGAHRLGRDVHRVRRDPDRSRVEDARPNAVEPERASLGLIKLAVQALEEHARLRRANAGLLERRRHKLAVLTGRLPHGARAADRHGLVLGLPGGRELLGVALELLRLLAHLVEPERLAPRLAKLGVHLAEEERRVHGRHAGIFQRGLVELGVASGRLPQSAGLFHPDLEGVHLLIGVFELRPEIRDVLRQIVEAVRHAVGVRSDVILKVDVPDGPDSAAHTERVRARGPFPGTTPRSTPDSPLGWPAATSPRVPPWPARSAALSSCAFRSGDTSRTRRSPSP